MLIKYIRDIQDNIQDKDYDERGWDKICFGLPYHQKKSCKKLRKLVTFMSVDSIMCNYGNTSLQSYYISNIINYKF